MLGHSQLLQRPPWCVFKRKKQKCWFYLQTFLLVTLLWAAMNRPIWYSRVCMCGRRERAFLFFFLVLFFFFFLSFAQQALGCRETWLGLDFLHWTLSYAAVPKHNFIWKCIDLKEENEFQLLWVLQTLCQTLEGSQLTDHKLQLRKGGLGLDIFFSYPLSRGFISVL